MTTTDRRQLLTEAAFAAVAKSGLEGLRLRPVAKAAGIDHSTLHHHFATKQDLVAAVVEMATRPLWGTIPENGAPAERLRTHLEILARLMGERPELFTVLAEIDLRANRDPAVAELVAGVETGWRRGLEHLFRAMKVDEPAIEVELVIATVKGIRLEPDAAPDVLARLANHLIDSEGHQP